MRKNLLMGLIVMLFLFVLTACGNNTGVENGSAEVISSESSFMEEIDNIDSLEELEEYAQDLYVNDPDSDGKVMEDSEKAKAVTNRYAKLLSNCVNGKYYSETTTENILHDLDYDPSQKFNLKEPSFYGMGEIENDILSSCMAVYWKNDDEIYVIPCDPDTEIVLEEIPHMENSNKYCYTLQTDDRETGLYAMMVSKDSNGLLAQRDGSFYYLSLSFHDDIFYISYFVQYENIEELNFEFGSGDFFSTQEEAQKYKQQRDAEIEAELEQQRHNNNAAASPRIGMTKSEVEASSWGKPQKVNKTTYTWGTTEQWVYSGNRYVYFTNGVVDVIQE